MTLTFPIFNISNLIQTLCATIAQPVAPTTQVNSESENALAERAFLRELLACNPEGIQSDLGLMPTREPDNAFFLHDWLQFQPSLCSQWFLIHPQSLRKYHIICYKERFRK